MRPTPAELEVARALIARVKAADSSIKRIDELLVCAAVACRSGEFGGVPTACARAMGKNISRPSQVTDWIARPGLRSLCKRLHRQGYANVALA